MPKFNDPAKEQAWLRRREQRERISGALFGRSVKTMIGVAFIAVGGIFAGMTIVAAARDGWDLSMFRVGRSIRLSRSRLAFCSFRNVMIGSRRGTIMAKARLACAGAL
jgi:hypothetical protein